MKFVSYAQNYEDVILWRALRHINGGCYIDVGAAWPDQHSVTRAFYERGWSGINIEPNVDFAKALELQRPSDINICAAVSDKIGTGILNMIAGTGLSTLSNDIAELHRNSGWIVRPQEAPITTLKKVCEEHIVDGRQIHFLKVDVEGMEASVLRSNDWNRYRPWIVVVEATMPLSEDETHAEWENVLIAAQYELAYVDGLNRFYIAMEHLELLNKFKFPPNIFDNYITYDHQRVIERAEIFEKRALDAEENLRQARAELEIAEDKALKTASLLSMVYSSKSWRYTAPLRWFLPKLLLMRRLIITEFKIALIDLISFLQNIMKRYPRIKKLIVVISKKIYIYDVLLTSAQRATSKVNMQNVKPTSIEELSPRAKEIYLRLKQNIKA